MNSGTSRRGIIVDEEVSLFSKVIPSSRQHQLTVFTNTTKKSGGQTRAPQTNPTKTNMLWFSGSPRNEKETKTVNSKSPYKRSAADKARHTAAEGFFNRH